MSTLNEAESGIAYRSGLSILQRTPDRSVIGLGYDLRRVMGELYADINDSTWRAIARRVVAARDAADAMNADPGYAPTRGELSTIPGSTLYEERYTYRVLVEVTGENGQTVTTVIDYRSDAALSSQQIAADLAANFPPALVSSTAGRNALRGIGEFNPPAVTVLGAGKRG